MYFVGRQIESDILDAQLSRLTAAFIVIYGRRRIGKTYFVRDYCERNGLILLEFTGLFDQRTSRQLAHFISRLNELDMEDSLPVPSSWTDAFRALNVFIDTHYSEKKVVIFLDEVPWMDTGRSGLLSAIGDLWDKRIANNPNKNLVICGSAASYMLKKVVRNKGPLHNRITKKVPMKTFNLNLTSEMFRLNKWHLTDKSICDLYMALGGVAKYLSDLDSRMTPEQAIQDLCFSSYALLKGEYQELFHSLFKNAKAHYAIMEFLVGKWSGVTRTEVSNGVDFSGSTISDAINELINSGFIEARPEFQKEKQNERLLASDMFCFFHYKWIKPKKVKSWQNTVNSQSYRIWTGHAFERICQMHAYQIKKKLGIQGVDTLTHYWQFKGSDSEPGAQIDMLLEHTSGGKNIEVIECKYYSSEFTIDKEYHDKLIRKIEVFKEKTNYRYNVRLVLVTANGVTKNKYFNSLMPVEITMSDLFSSEP